MSTFLHYLYSKPFFAVCFVFSAIPFWVPILGLFSGSDPILMLLVSLLSVTAKAYVDSELSYSSPLALMADYFFAKPFIFAAKLILAIVAGVVFYSYGMGGEPLDKAIAALLMVWTFISLYMRRVKHAYWNIKGLGIYRLYSLGGKLLTAFLWIAFFTLSFSVADCIAVGAAAVLVHVLTFFKVNEGLI